MASRRRLNTSSDGYPVSPTLEKDISANFRLLSLLDAVPDEESLMQEAHGLHSNELDLHRMLSLRSQISTTSSDAQRHATAQDQNENYFRKIGAGACGAVFGQDGKSVVSKLAKTDDEQSLWNDYSMHSWIAHQFKKWDFSQVRVPECLYFVPKDDPHYFNNCPDLVEAAQEICHMPTSVLVTERILPLPKSVRTLLIEKYCSPRVKQAALDDIANKDCLVRVYLGSMQGKTGGLFFSLRNFKMHLNQMLELQLDIKEMAGRMAIAMAIMHWAAKTDARDVEFVLGSSSKKTFVQLNGPEVQNLPRPMYTGPISHVHEDFFIRTTDLWLLDFNQVRRISLDEAGVAQAIEAATINDPYIPKPLQASRVERLVWNEFVQQYLLASDTILAQEDGHNLLALPRMFIRGLISFQRERQQRQQYFTTDTQ
ncbi:pre-mrna splicing factor atp-dependent rna helicase prp43 [Trichoderma arundinaceum]|uniref:Pre-mrna splicing factor atp-dependent rna helicase prp43 n=1 Tax=Trichoderma arundinaceum TaxID=490622 RepID=A0A395P1G1_TRIAR|nr:pre-mrna splicing factor atp-dependent rna helicase prp43 [Trichoderma arundinaceum]